MSDVRALLRQQREARRITHPHAVYSDQGKLLCALCREHVRAESYWEAHLKSASHRQNLASATGTGTGSQKRKLDVDRNGDNNNSDDNALQGRGGEGEDEDEDEEQAARRKRTKPDSSPPPAVTTPGSNGERKTPQHPSLTRRKSTTLSQGVEIQIPSRSTPPSLRREEQSSASPLSSSLTPQAGASASASTPLLSRQASSNITPVAEASTTSIHASAVPTPPPSSSLSATGQVDESEWAAFEADIASASAPYASDATISRPAMTAEESAAAAAKQAQEDAAQNGSSTTTSRKAKADADIEDEREEATRALEEEFDEMQELEARVRRLKEKRETLLRRREVSALGMGKEGERGHADKENRGTPMAEIGDAMKNEDDDDDDDDDDWDSFRFRKGR